MDYVKCDYKTTERVIWINGKFEMRSLGSLGTLNLDLYGGFCLFKGSFTLHCHQVLAYEGTAFNSCVILNIIKECGLYLLYMWTVWDNSCFDLSL